MTAIAPESIDPLALPSLPLVDRRQLPNCAGIYLVLEGETVIYVGQSTNIRQRWRAYHHRRPLLQVLDSVKIAWLEVSAPSSLESLKSIEENLIKRFNPALNGTVPIILHRSHEELVKYIAKKVKERECAITRRHP